MLRIAGAIAQNKDELIFYKQILNNVLAGQRARHLGHITYIDNQLGKIITDTIKQ